MSLLTKIELINFMSLRNAILEFDSSGIISPVGWNDSGKSAVTRALAVLWYDAYSQSQVKFITDGESSFVVRNYFDDGVMIQRTKYASGQSHWLMQQGENVVYTNQLPNGGFAATKGVPDTIKSYLRVLQDEATGEVLNVRRNTDKLLGVATTGGETYKIFNNLCQGERLTFAVAEVNKDVNALNRQTTQKQSRLIGMKDSLSSFKLFDEASEKAIMEGCHQLSKVNAQLQSVVEAAEKLSSYADYSIIPELPVVPLDKLEFLLQCKTAHDNAQYQIIDMLPEVSLDQYSLLLQAKELADACSGTVIPAILMTDIDRYAAILDVYKAYLKLKKSEEEIQYGEAWLANERKLLREIAEANDWRVCHECGAIVEKEGTA